MKKLILLIPALILTFAFTACGNMGDEPKEAADSSQGAEPVIEVVQNNELAELTINGNKADIGEAVSVEDTIVGGEFIVVITGGTDIRSNPIFIFDYDGNTLFKTHYLSNNGMVISGASDVSVDAGTISMRGTRLTHGPSLVMASDLSGDYAEYSEYLYEDTVYTYDFVSPADAYAEVYIDPNYSEEAALLNEDEAVTADFEMEYLGGGKFGNIKMTGVIQTLGEYLEEFSGASND